MKQSLSVESSTNPIRDHSGPFAICALENSLQLIVAPSRLEKRGDERYEGLRQCQKGRRAFQVPFRLGNEGI
jgi:hypothetical protein